MVRKDKMVLTSDETIHYFISTHLSYQPRDGLAMWRQRAFTPKKRKRKRCSLSPRSHTSYLYADKPKMKLQYNKCYEMFLDGCFRISTELLYI